VNEDMEKKLEKLKEWMKRGEREGSKNDNWRGLQGKDGRKGG